MEPRLAAVRAGVRDYAQRNRALLWPLVPVLLLCVLSAPLLGAWMRWVELPGLLREEALQPCADMAPAARGQATAARATAPDTRAANTALDAQEAALAPSRCAGMRRIDSTGLRTAIYRFDDGSIFTLHLRAPPAALAQASPAMLPGEDRPASEGDDLAADLPTHLATDVRADASTATTHDASAMPSARPTAGPIEGGSVQGGEPRTAGPATGSGIDSGSDSIGDADSALDTPDASATVGPADANPGAHLAGPVPPPILTATCPVQSRQSLLVLVGLLMIGVVVVLHRLRAGGKFLDFRSVVSAPLRPGEVLLLIYAFALMAGTGIGLQFGRCAAADHRDAVQVERTPKALKDLMQPATR